MHSMLRLESSHRLIEGSDASIIVWQFTFDAETEARKIDQKATA
jgi:hypothetical protein